jgi:hypothetical protein
MTSLADYHQVVNAGRSWRGRYPPLLVIVVALTLAVFALPSALNLPQANPAQTLEYAPVPGDQGTAAAGGNFAGLGLGGGGAAGVAGVPPADQSASQPPPPPVLTATGMTPSNKQCVGNPPRQSEDPLSPPCVAFFNGDNGGATYAGVTANSARVIFDFDTYPPPGGATTSRGTEYSPNSGYSDADAQPQSGDFIYLRVMRTWQTYFNTRYQTYGRHVHFLLNYSSDTSAGGRRAMAHSDFAQHPFAAMPYFDIGGNTDPYVQEITSDRVMVFGGHSLLSTAYYQAKPGLIWGFRTPVERLASQYSSWVCTKAKPFPTSFSGNPGENRQPRKYGMISTNDPNHPELIALAGLVRQQVKACGITLSDDRTFSPEGAAVETGDTSYAQVNMSAFKKERITTILWPGGYETYQSKAASSLAYTPEWMLLGDGKTDSNGNSSFQSAQEWDHAWVLTPVTTADANGYEPACEEAAHSVDSSISATDMGYYCESYDDLRQLFTGIQVSGPRLTPANIEQGFRAIPANPSGSPYVPACYYLPGDYTCVKDARPEWWSSTTGRGGCWMQPQGGARILFPNWPSGNIDAQKSRSDSCNPYHNLE